MKLCVLFKESGATLRQRTRIYSGIGWPSIFSILLRDEAQNQEEKKRRADTDFTDVERDGSSKSGNNKNGEEEAERETEGRSRKDVGEGKKTKRIE